MCWNARLAAFGDGEDRSGLFRGPARAPEISCAETGQFGATKVKTSTALWAAAAILTAGAGPSQAATFVQTGQHLSSFAWARTLLASQQVYGGAGQSALAAVGNAANGAGASAALASGGVTLAASGHVAASAPDTYNYNGTAQAILGLTGANTGPTSLDLYLDFTFSSLSVRATSVTGINPPRNAIFDLSLLSTQSTLGRIQGSSLSGGSGTSGVNCAFLGPTDYQCLGGPQTVSIYLGALGPGAGFADNFTLLLLAYDGSSFPTGRNVDASHVSASLAGASLQLRGVTAPPPGVPEPGAWALMIAGFGLIGSALRRRALASSGITP